MWYFELKIFLYKADNVEQYEIEYEFNNTVGPKSISKQELIFKFNPLLQ